MKRSLLALFVFGGASLIWADAARADQVLGAAAQVDADVQADPDAALFDDASRERLSELLGHEVFAVRERAEALLLVDDGVNRVVLRDLLLDATSYEQRGRLLRIAEHHVLRVIREDLFGGQGNDPDPLRNANNPNVFFNTNGAAVGFSYDAVPADRFPSVNLEGVLVIATMPGFPAYAHLRPGDVIVAIDGSNTAERHPHQAVTNWISWRISQRRPGDTMRFTVMRSGELIDVALKCAEATALNQMYDTDAFKASARTRPYEQRWQEVRSKLTAELPRIDAVTLIDREPDGAADPQPAD